MLEKTCETLVIVATLFIVVDEFGHSAKEGEINMGDKGKKDKGRREQQKKARLNLKEKRRLKKEKKNE